MAISLVTNQAYLATPNAIEQSSVVADVKAAQQNEKRVPAAVTKTDSDSQASLRIAERLAERSQQATDVEKERLSNLHQTKQLLEEVNTVAGQMDKEMYSSESTKNNDNIAELNSKLQDLTQQLEQVQSEQARNESATSNSDQEQQVSVKFSSSELTSIVEGLKASQQQQGINSNQQGLLSEESELMAQLAQTKARIEAEMDASEVESKQLEPQTALEAGIAAKTVMLAEVGSESLSGTYTTPEMTVSILR